MKYNCETMTTPAPVKALITFDDFQKLDIRVGTIERVEDVPKSSKLLRLIVDFGDHKRTILAGMKQERENPPLLRFAPVSADAQIHS